MKTVKFQQTTVITDNETGEEISRDVVERCYDVHVQMNKANTMPYAKLVSIACNNAGEGGGNNNEPPNDNGGGNNNPPPDAPLPAIELAYEFVLDPACDYTNRFPNLRVGNAIPISNASGNGLEWTPDGRYTGLLSAGATENTTDQEGLTGTKTIERVDDPNAYVAVLMSPKRFVNQYDPNALDGRTPVGNADYRPVEILEDGVLATDWTYIEEGNNVVYWKKFPNDIVSIPSLTFNV
jgi:hypothetical protein